jgi:hypothetical protein
MQAIQAIVDTYVRLRNEAALLALKQQRLKVLATCDPNNPVFAKLRGQCLQEISEIDAGLEKLRPTPVLPAPLPSVPRSNVPAAKKTFDPPPIPAPTEPPQPFAASHVAPSLLASTLLAASLSAKLPTGAEKPEQELIRLQIALERRMKSQT